MCCFMRKKSAFLVYVQFIDFTVIQLQFKPGIDNVEIKWDQ